MEVQRKNLDQTEKLKDLEQSSACGQDEPSDVREGMQRKKEDQEQE